MANMASFCSYCQGGKNVVSAAIGNGGKECLNLSLALASLCSALLALLMVAVLEEKTSLASQHHQTLDSLEELIQP